MESKLFHKALVVHKVSDLYTKNTMLPELINFLLLFVSASAFFLAAKGALQEWCARTKLRTSQIWRNQYERCHMMLKNSVKLLWGLFGAWIHNPIIFHLCGFVARFYHIFWLVVYLPLWKIWKSVGISVPNIWKKHVPNHQPVLICYLPSEFLGVVLVLTETWKLAVFRCFFNVLKIRLDNVPDSIYLRITTMYKYIIIYTLPILITI